MIERANNTVQVGASNEKRKVQAKEAYIVRRKLDPLKTYMLLDDVWTTGSSMMAAYEKNLPGGGPEDCDRGNC